MTHDLAGTAHDLTLTFAYNPASQIVQSTRSNPGSGPGQADLYAFTGHGSGTIAGTVNGLNQLVSHGGTALSHDAKGNMTFDGVRTFGYTADNKLATVNGAGWLAYDPLGRLYWIAEPVVFGHDGNEVVEELVYEYPAYPIARRYVHGPGVDEPIVWYEGSGTSDRRFLHADERGSIVAVSDSAGTVTAVNRYDEYGKPAPANTGRFQYTGQAWMPLLGLYDYKARFYWPDGGRFMQTDPSGYSDGPNWYVYVGGDPVNMVDPDGTTPAPTAKAMGNMLSYLWDQAGPETKETIADVVDGVGILVDIVTLPSGVGSGPEGIAGAKLISTAIRKSAREGGEATAQRAASRARGVPDTRIGPSGKPTQHTVVHSGKKESREAAERNMPRGGRVRHDATPANPKQGPHHQAETAKGKNAHPTVHHEYPKRKQ